MPRSDMSDTRRLYDMLAAARLVVAFTAGKRWEDYQADVLLRSGVERQVSIVGEAAWRTTAEFKAQHPEIPWEKIAPARHRLVHDYDQIDDTILWSIATRHIPPLIAQIEALLPPIPGEDSETEA
ncbi:MAG: DUF86 domain-containing protein [Phycisphaerales bacterium]